MGCLRLTHDVETSFSADAPLSVVYRKREVGEDSECVLGEVCGNGQQNQGGGTKSWVDDLFWWAQNADDGDTYDPNKSTQNGGRPDLGFVGNKIRDRAGSEFSKDLFENYWQGGGDINISNQRFNSIVNEATSPVGSAKNVTLSNGQSGTAQVFNFYNSSEYSLAIGNGTIFYNQAGTAVGFNDTYDFNPLWFNTHRSLTNELKTIGVHTAGSLYGAKPFNFSYGVTGKP